MWMFLFLQSHSLQNKRSIFSDQLQIFQAIPNAVVEHIRRNIICQFFDLRRSISHGNLCCSVFKHGKIIVAVSKNNGILPRNIKQADHSCDPNSLVKALWHQFNGISHKRTAAFMADDIIVF